MKNMLRELISVALCWNAMALSQEANQIQPNENDNMKADQQNSERISFGEILEKRGAELGCHFTLEYRGKSITGEVSKAALSNLVSVRNLDAESIPSFLSLLRKYLDGFIIEPDSGNPNIVHIIEKVLVNDPSYPLNKEVTISYSGKFGATYAQKANGYLETASTGLFGAVAEKVKDLRRGSFSDLSVGAGYAADRSVINVDIANEAARNVLSDYVPLKNYNAVIWRAVEERMPGEESEKVVFFVYFGPKH